MSFVQSQMRLKFRRILDEAIKLTEDARFHGENAKKHIGKHAKQMGLTPLQYLQESEKLSLAGVNKFGSGGIEGFVRKDGCIVKYDTSKQWLCVYRGNIIYTFCPYRANQWNKEYETQYAKDV